MINLGIFHLEEEKKFKDQYEKLLNVIKTEETNLENAISKLEEKKQKIQETILPSPNFYFRAENNIKSFIDIRFILFYFILFFILKFNKKW